MTFDLFSYLPQSLNPYYGTDPSSSSASADPSSSSVSADPSSSSFSEAFIDRSPLSRVPTAESCFTDKQAIITNERYQNEESCFSATKGIKVSLLPGPKSAQKPNLIPDGSTSYYVQKIKMRRGWKLTLKGEYPHARYLSYTNANELGGGQIGNGSFLRAAQIKADRGSINPFVAGNNRNVPNRSYTMHVVHGVAPGEPEENTLYTGSDADELRIHFSSRNYLPDKNYDGTGNVMLDEEGYGLPEYSLTIPGKEPITDQKVLFGMLEPQKDGDPNGYELGQWQKEVAASGDPLNAPCLPGAVVEKFCNTKFSVEGVFIKNPEKRVVECPPDESGGFANNPDTSYLITGYSLKLPSDPGNFPTPSTSIESESAPEVENKLPLSGFGEVLVVRGKMPTHPKTRQGGDSLPEDPQVQYFSATTYGSAPSGQGYETKCDEQMPLNKDDYYTVAVTTPWNRPKNATLKNGVSNLDIGHGEGYFSGARPGVGCLCFRYMNPSENWDKSPANIPVPSEKEPISQGPVVMEEFFPVSLYISREEFESIDWNKITLEEWNELCKSKIPTQ